MPEYKKRQPQKAIDEGRVPEGIKPTTKQYPFGEGKSMPHQKKTTIKKRWGPLGEAVGSATRGVGEATKSKSKKTMGIGNVGGATRGAAGIGSGRETEVGHMNIGGKILGKIRTSTNPKKS